MNKDHQKQALRLILVFTAIRLVTGGLLELGVDEVYYRNYAIRPDWNYFDHPPLVGLAIQLTTLNLLLDSELFIRLPAILGAAINSWLLYRITSRLADEKSGIIALLLYNGSIYFGIISGLFILPDSVQVIFWLLCIQLALDIFNRKQNATYQWLLFGLAAGLCTMSKVHGLFAWVAAGLYILLYNRQQLRNGYLYAGVLVTLLTISPILVWNIQYDFITYRFHSERVSPGFQFNTDALLREIAGSFAYQNPVNFVLYVMMVIALFRKQFTLPATTTRLMLLFALPLILTFLLISTQRDTLPHWNGPGYLPLLIMTAIWLGQKPTAGLPRSAKASVIVTGSVLLLGMAMIFGAPFTIGVKDKATLGQYDFTLDLYGWKQTGEGLKMIYERDKSKGLIASDVKIISNKYFPASHLDYYAARPLGLELIGIGPLNDIHLYGWLNNDRSQLRVGENAYCVVPSNYPSEPQQLYGEYFNRIRCTDTIKVYRNGALVRYGFVYLMENCKKIPEPSVPQKP